MNTKISEIENAKVMNSVESANVQAGKSTESARQPKGKARSQFWSVITKARRTFDSQLHKDNKVKLESIEHFIPTISPDSLKFWADYMDEVNILLDSKKFEKECGELKIDSTTLATHIVYMGAGKRNAVINNGILNTLGSKCRDFNEQFVPEVALKYGLNYVPKKTEDSENTSTDTAA